MARRISLLGIALALGACGGANAPEEHAADSVVVQLTADAEPPRLPAADGDGAPIVPLEALGPVDAPPLLRLPVPRGEDPVGFARTAADRTGVEYAEPVYLYAQSRAPNDTRFKELWGLSADTIRTWFEDEPGVLVIRNEATRKKRRYVTLRIPATVAQRVHRKHQQ